MLSHQPAAVLARWPIPALLSHLAGLRRIDARRRLDEFNLRMAATRGDEESVQAVGRALREAAGRDTVSTAGDPEDLMAALAGG